MKWLRFYRRTRRDTEALREIEFHIEEETEQNMASGMPAIEARRAAVSRFGNAALVREEIFRMNDLGLDTLWQDSRYAIRSLRRSPGFTAVAVGTLAVGIASIAAIFSFVDAVLLKPLPYPHADRIVRLLEKRPTGETAWISTLDYLDWRDGNTVFDQMAVQQDGTTILTIAGEPISLRVGRVSAHYFDVFGVKALLGRTFEEGEDQPGNDQVAVLSHRVWLGQFGADPAIVGQPILLDNRAYKVIGILPPQTAFDRGAAQIWYPLAFRPSNMTRDYRWLSGSFATLKADVSLGQARSQMASIAATIAKSYPDSHSGWGVAVDRYADSIVGPQLRTSLLALMAAVGSLLLICCSNLANLALARALSRSHETATRAAIGASRYRLARQFFVESGILSLFGGAAGIGLAYAAVGWLKTFLPAGTFAREVNVQMDARVLLFAVAVSVATGLIFGVAPALHAAGASLHGAMKQRGQSKPVRAALVISEVAVAFALLCVSGLLIRSFFGLLYVDAGFESDKVLTMGLPIPGFPPGSVYANTEEFNAYVRQLKASVEDVAGVRGAAITNALPLTDCCLYTLSLRVANLTESTGANRGGGYFKVVTPSYFATLGLKLRRGRFLTDHDNAQSRRVVVVNERLAKRYFGNKDPIGQRIFNPQILPGKTERGADVEWEIVGVAGNEKISGLSDEATAVVYASYEQSPVYFANLVARTSGDPALLIEPVRRAVRRLNRAQAITNIRAMDLIKSDSLGTERFQTLLLTLFSAIALLLAAVGMYGVISYSVTQRTFELGIRAALGASRPNLFRLVLGNGFTLVLIGLAIGLAAALRMGPLLQSILYGIKPHDPYTMAAVALVLMVVSLLACLAPALRASKIDPVLSLRAK